MNKLSTNEIRKKFLAYFKKQKHTIIDSSPLVPINDPSIFFTNAGMVQFKGVFLGKEKRTYTRAASIQRCLRASGKHNDLDNVGYTTRHHTFFEMLGNFSFGDYFKREAIHYAWEFLTRELEIPPEKLWITVHEKDREAEKIWEEEFGQTKTSPQGLSHCGDKDNFWAMGETGPCGYCSEIFYDHGAKLKGDPPGGKNEGERYVEIWNLVFMQFERNSSNNLTALPQVAIDTGMGLERIAAVMQGVYDNYATDNFIELSRHFIATLVRENLTKNYSIDGEEIKIASRVVVDHIRAALFLIAEGVMPNNEKSGYVLRSIIRRAVYYLYRIGARTPLFYSMAGPLVTIMDSVYPELQLTQQQNKISATIEEEEIKFLATLDRGLKILEQEINKLTSRIIPGTLAFNLHDTYGLPIILTAEIARSRGFILDQEGFTNEMEKQRQTAKAAAKPMLISQQLQLDCAETTKFVGYVQNSCSTKLIKILTKEGIPTDTLLSGEPGIIILAETPFYAEAGGQIGDSGEIHEASSTFIVQDTQKYNSLHLHYGYMAAGSLAINHLVTATIDIKKRQAIKLNHSATHLLHRGLRILLGENIAQKGSLVDDKKLRFDFSHATALTAAKIAQLEKLINSQIRNNLLVKTTYSSLAEAKNTGALALFGEKYGDEVRIVTMDGFSKELCGGTHVAYTGEIGLFKIVNEASIASGMRRIEAVTGENALIKVEIMESQLKKIAKILGIGIEQSADKLKQLTKEKELQEQKLLSLRQELSLNKNKELASKAIKIKDTFVLATSIQAADSKTLRQLVDSLKQQLQSAVVVLAAINDNKIQLIVGVTKDLLSTIQANKLLSNLTQQLGGSGGGRIDLAEGGGTNIAALPKALESVLPLVKKLLLAI